MVGRVFHIWQLLPNLVYGEIELREIFYISASFENFKNPSDRFVLLTNLCVSVRGIRKQLSVAVGKKIVQDWL